MARTIPKIKAPSKALAKARSSVERAKDDWATNTINGFMEKWVVWYGNFVVPQLARVRLPPKTGDIAKDVANRVTPVAIAVSKASEAYRRHKLTQMAREMAPVMPVSPPSG